MALRGFWSVVTEPSVRSALRTLSRSLFESLCLSPALLSASLPVLWVGMGTKLWDPVRRLSLGSKTPFKRRQWWRNSLHSHFFFPDDNGCIYNECDTRRMQVHSCVLPLFCPNGILIFLFQLEFENMAICCCHLKITTGFPDELHRLLQTYQESWIIHLLHRCDCVILMVHLPRDHKGEDTEYNISGATDGPPL